jgi:hypothetical protein
MAQATTDTLKELRSALSGVTNAGGVDPAFDSVEIEARINKGIVDASPKFNEIRAMIPRESMDGQASFIWNVRTSDNSSTRWSYSYTEAVVTSNTNSNTAAQGAKVQLYAVAKSFRTDWEVENFFKAASGSYYDAVADEVNNALAKHVDDEERQIVTGTASSGYGSTAGFQGLRQIIDSFLAPVSSTATVFGITRASGKTYLDSQVVDAASSGLKLTHLDAALTAQKKRQGMPGMFVFSYERCDELNSLLQAQQRFTGTVNTPAGFTVPTYNGVPIIRSRYADKAGSSDTDTVIFLTAANNLSMKVLQETQNVNADLGRSDAVGGYIKTYEVLIAKDLTKNVLIARLAVPTA